MAAPLTIALDAMGGDHAPATVISGAELAAERAPEARFLLYGDEAQIKPLLDQAKRLPAARVELLHTAEAVKGDDKPSQVLRKGRQTSMALAIDAVRAGQARGVVSAGNTGALMALAKIMLKTQPGIDRPAIASFLPTLRGESVMLDLGANVQCDAGNLVEFAVMGAEFAHCTLGLPRPTVGLLNVGTEEVKGHEAIREAAQIIRDAKNLPFDFHGFIEGNDIARGTVDVVVADGFSGNIALKTAEGTAKLVMQFLVATFKSSWLSRLGYVLARPALRAMRDRIDPQRYNGGVLLGLNGIVVKSHGAADSGGFANAIGVAIDMARENILEQIARDFRALGLRSVSPDPDTPPRAVAS
jgi:glycerol-3-phosphate acyltransferase PlsX